MYIASLLCVSLALKMARKPLCPNSPANSKGWWKCGNWQTDKETAKRIGVNTPQQVWSGDETRVQTIPKERKVLAVKSKMVFQQVSAEQGEMSTILTFISGAGHVVPSMVIHKGEFVKDNWTWKAPGNVRVAATSKGYKIKAKFHEYGGWFVAYLRQNGLLGMPHLLICDSHSGNLYNLPFFQHYIAWYILCLHLHYLPLCHLSSQVSVLVSPPSDQIICT